MSKWILHNEDTLTFWVHRIKTTRFLKRRVIDDRLAATSAEYLIFEFRRTWYNSETREFDTETEVVRTIDDVVADGTRAVYDWRSREWIYAAGALT